MNLFIVTHSHRFGADAKLFQSEKASLTVEDVEAHFDYEPGRDEEDLDIIPYTPADIITV